MPKTLSGFRRAPIIPNSPPDVLLTGTIRNIVWDFLEGDAARSICPAATVTDSDHTELTYARFVLNGILDGDAEELTLGGAVFPLATDAATPVEITIGGETFEATYDADTFTVLVTGEAGGTAHKTDWQLLLRSTQFEHTGVGVTEGARTITVTLSDGTHESLAAVATVNVFENDIATIFFPQATVTVTRPAHYADAATHFPADMDELNDLCAGIDIGTGVIAPGDIVELDKDTIYEGQWLLPASLQGTPGNEIIFRSSGWASLPAFGTRVLPAHETHMPTLRNIAGSGSANRRVMQGLASTDGSGGCAHLYFCGLEFDSTLTGSTQRVTRFLGFGIGTTLGGSQAITNEADFPHHCTLDQCSIHGGDTTYMANCLTLNGKYLALVSSRLYNVHDVGGNEGIGINPYSCPGPLLIENNFLEASSITILMGDNAARDYLPAIPENTPPTPETGPRIQPCDVTIQYNHFYVRPEWEGDIWQHKNFYESKDSTRVLIQYNVFENGWTKGQPRSSFYPKTVGQGCQSSHQIFRWNLAINGEYCFRLGNVDSITNRIDGLPPSHIAITDNLFWDMDNVGKLGNGDLNVVHIERNTCVTVGIWDDPVGQDRWQPQWEGGTARSNWVVRDNIVDPISPHYIWKHPSGGEGVDSFNEACADYIFTHNIIRGVSNSAFNDGAQVGSTAGNNATPATQAEIGYVDAENHDYELDDASPFATASSSGGKPGCDVPTLLAAIAGVREIF